MMQSADLLEKKLEIQFQNKKILQQALTHRSYLNESRDNDTGHNERLEYLGDAVLELIVSVHLFQTYPAKPEGELTSFRAAIVRTTSLAESAREMGLGEFLFMSKGEEASGGRDREYILANSFEALLGGIYLDHGLADCQKLVARYLFPKIPEIVEKRLDIDNKSKLQEMAQEKYNSTPEYEFVSAVGPDHAKTFTMAVKIAGKTFAKGKGKSKQEAEQDAAAAALEKWTEWKYNLSNV